MAGKHDRPVVKPRMARKPVPLSAEAAATIEAKAPVAVKPVAAAKPVVAVKPAAAKVPAAKPVAVAAVKPAPVKVAAKPVPAAPAAAPSRVARIAPTVRTAATVSAATIGNKKVAKGKAAAFKAGWSPQNIHKKTSAALKGMMATAAKEFNNSAMLVAGDAGRLVIGIPFPAFCLEYMFQNTVWPLGRELQLVGPPGVCKSGFAFEVGRWFINLCGGLVGLKEHESKYSPDWAMSIIGWNNPDSLGHFEAHSVDEWQKLQQWFIKQNQVLMDGTPKEPGPGRVYPVLSIVDSILGKSMAESQNRIETAGFAGRDFAIEAQSVTKWMRFIPQQITQWPMSIIFVNHEKPSKEAGSNVVTRNKPGGLQKEYQETFEIGVSKIGKIATKDFDGLKVQLRLYKNSLGVTDRRFTVSIKWQDQPINEEGLPGDPDKDPWKQVTVFDWDEATINLLLNLPDSDKARAKGIVDLVPYKGPHGKLYIKSTRLGISETAKLDYTQAGKVLAENTDVINELRRVFGVKKRQEFQPGVCYSFQRDGVLRKIGAKRRVVTAVEKKPRYGK